MSESLLVNISHIQATLIKHRQNKNGDYVATWQLMGINFESISAEMLETIDSQVATLVRSFSGLPVSFYNHSCRASFMMPLPQNQVINMLI